MTAYCNVHKIYFEIKEARSLTRHFVECPKCLKEKNKRNAEKNKKPWKDVLKSFRDKYGDKFTYNESTYYGMEHEMKVKCNDCGSEFEITPIHHLKYINGGCPICHKHKTRTCSKCGREFEVNHHYADSIVFVCKECKDKEKIGHRKRSTINRIQRTKEEQNQYDKMRSRLYR